MPCLKSIRAWQYSVIFRHQHEFGISFNSKLSRILTHLFDHWRHAGAHGFADDVPDNRGHSEHEHTDSENADTLNEHVPARRDADGQRSPYAGEQVCRNGAYNVINPDYLHEPHAEQANGAANATDNDRPVVADNIGTGGDGDKTGDRPVQAGKKINPAENRA